MPTQNTIAIASSYASAQMLRISVCQFGQLRYAYNVGTTMNNIGLI